MICVLLLHFQIFFHQDKKREIGIEKMKINEEIYRSIIAPVSYTHLDVYKRQTIISEKVAGVSLVHKYCKI